MTTLESRNFVATEQDVAAITRSYLTAINSQNAAKSTYLRALVATVQSEFTTDQPVKRSPPAEVVSASIKVLDAVHERFYATVIGVIGETDIDDDVKKGSKADKLHRRAVFARTAASTLRRWIRAGHDVRNLKAAAVTKAALLTARKAREVSAAGGPVNPIKRALQLGDQIAELATDLASTDRAGAIDALESAMARLAQALMDLGGRATTQAELAVKNHRMLKTAEGVFWPVQPPVAPPS
jgi:hypothetical protein